MIKTIQHTMPSQLVKYEEDIIKAYRNLYGEFTVRNQELFSAFNSSFTPLIEEILNSYYFENDFNASTKVLEGFQAGRLEITYHKNYTAVPFLGLDYRGYEKMDHNLVVDFDALKESLKKIDPFYELIFEKDTLKRKLNIIKKHDIEYKIVKVGERDIAKVFSEFHKISKYEKNWNQQYAQYEYDDSMNDNLKYLNRMEFLNFDYMTNRLFVVAYNQNQIVGLASLTEYSMLDKLNEKKQYYAKKNIMYNSVVMVASQFRGQGIGLELLNKSFDYANDNNLIFIRSHPSRDGSKYLYKNANELALKKTDVCIINSPLEDVFCMFKNQLKNVNNDKEYNIFLNVLKPAIKEITKIYDQYELLKNEHKDFEIIDNITNEQTKIIRKIISKTQQDLTKAQLISRKNKYVR